MGSFVTDSGNQPETVGGSPSLASCWTIRSSYERELRRAARRDSVRERRRGSGRSHPRRRRLLVSRGERGREVRATAEGRMGRTMSKREDEIQARLDAADADLRAQNAWVDFTDHAHDDVAYLLNRVRRLEMAIRQVTSDRWGFWCGDEDCPEAGCSEGFAAYRTLRAALKEGESSE